MIGYQLTLNAARHPDAVAVAFGARRLTYAALEDRACRLANGLAGLGIRQGDRVAALVHNCTPFLEALFATAKLGAIFVPINFRLVAREIGALLDACSPKVLLAGESFADVLATLEARPNFPAHRIWVDDAFPVDATPNPAHPYEGWLAGQRTDRPEPVVARDAVQMLMHSSGTTGLPKGIVYTHATTLASSMAKIIDFELKPTDAVVVFGPLFHAGPLLDLALPLLLRGGRLALGASRQFDPAKLLATIASERGTMVQIYPTMLRRLLHEIPDFGVYDLASLRMILTGGEPASVAVIRGMHERLPHVAFVNTYGSTEVGPITTRLLGPDFLRKIGSVGQEAFGQEIRIADENDRPYPSGQVGEVVVRGPFVSPGYWNRPDLTAESSRNGWWHTGDLAWRDDDGFIFIAGRSKDMIKSGAENIYPIEIEQVIAGLPGVVEVGVIGVPDEEWGESVVAVIVQASGAALDAARVVAHCRENLASYKKPRHVCFVDGLPRNTTNKVDKSALRARFAELGRRR
ncbi:MAG TPA: AMP-binding protein [Casimicrobiaceae bacterium]|nr:AMP-binding protein [Casimicrobiaceae bacterium]